MAGIGAQEYRDGANERLQDALVLLREERFAGAIYLGGRAVEAMLRAIIWRTDREYATGKKSLETGHDIREMLLLVKNLGLLRRDLVHESVANDVQKVARLWWNNMRYFPNRKVESLWYDVGEIGRRRTMKQAATQYYEACSNIIKRCEALWQD